MPHPNTRSNALADRLILGARKVAYEEHSIIKDFLSNCIIIDLNQSIKDITINLAGSKSLNQFIVFSVTSAVLLFICPTVQCM